MARIYNIITPNEKITRRAEPKITLNFIKKYLYDNPMNLMLSWYVNPVLVPGVNYNLFILISDK